MVIGSEEFSREFITAIRKLNEAIQILNRLSGFTNWQEIKALLDKARAEVDFIIEDDQIPDSRQKIESQEEEFISVNKFCNDLGYIFTEEPIIERLKNDNHFFKICGRITDLNEYQIKKETAISYLSTKSGKIGSRIRNYIISRNSQKLPARPIC